VAFILAGFALFVLDWCGQRPQLGVFVSTCGYSLFFVVVGFVSAVGFFVLFLALAKCCLLLAALLPRTTGGFLFYFWL
jgi:hypothetical protein